MQTNQHIAILIFTRTAAEEGLHKRYTGTADVNRCIANSFILHTLSEAYSTCFPVFIISSHQQKGGNFGERLTNAMSDIFDKGYDKVITIGTDTPDLKATHLQKVAQLLETHDYVSGPSVDGGVYVIGFSKKVFNKRQLRDIPWKTSVVNNSLNQYIQQYGYSGAEIEVLADIDDSYSLNNWIAISKDSALVYRIQQLITKQIQHYSTIESGFIIPIYSSTISHRGPPSVATYI